MKTLPRFFRISILLAYLFVAACNTSTEQIIITPIPTAANTQEISPTATPSSAPQPTETSLPAIRLTPPPTITHELQDQFLQLLKTNGDCELPCFLGITPGKTTWDEANKALEKYATQDKPIKPYKTVSKRGYQFYTVSVVTTLFDPGLDASIELEVDKDNIIQYILAPMPIRRKGLPLENDPLLSRYSLLELLKRTGIPDVVYVGLPAQDFNHAEIGVFYEQKKIVAYPFIATTKGREIDRTILCPIRENHPHTLALASPDNPIDIKTLLNYPFYESSPGIQEIELSKEKVLEFYNAALKGKPDCITIPLVK